MGFFDFLKTSYSKEELIKICKNDRRILSDNMLAQARAISRKTVKFFWSMEQTGTCTIQEVASGIYRVTLNGSVSGLDDFGNITDDFNYTKTIYIDQYGDMNATVGSNSVTLRKRR